MENIEVVELESLLDAEEILVAMEDSGSCKSSGH